MERIHPANAHPYVLADHIHRYKWASQFCRGKVLDFACGVGYGSSYVIDASPVIQYVGADLSFDALLIARKEFSLLSSKSFFCAHSDFLPIVSSSFDTIICFETLEHLEDPERLISQFHKILKEDGLLIGSVPSRLQEELIEKIYGPNPYHKTRFGVNELLFLLRRYFNHVILYKQSLEVGSVIVPHEQISDLNGQLVQDERLPALEHGNILFIASKSSIGFQKGVVNQISFAPALSLFDVDRTNNQHLRGLEEEIERLSMEKAQKEAELEGVKREMEREIERLSMEKAQKEAELEGVKREMEREIERLSMEKAQKEAELEGVKREMEREIERLSMEKAQKEAELEGVKREMERLNQEIANLENQLAEINLSRYWRAVKWLWKQPLYIWFRNVVLRVCKVFSGGAYYKNKNVPGYDKPTTQKESDEDGVRQFPVLSHKRSKLSEQEIRWLDGIAQRKPDVISVQHPEWKGIHASAEQMFDVLLDIPDTLEPESALHYAELIEATGCSKVVLSGFPVSYRYLVLALRHKFPRIKILAVYHGNYNQYREDYDRLSFSTLLNLAKAGKIDKLGFVKAGMAEVITAGTGVRTGFLMNWIDRIPEKPSEPLAGGPHLGLWLLWSGNWQKPPFTMLASSLLIPGSVVHGADSDDRLNEYIRLLNIQAEFAGRPLLRSELFEKMSKMHVNLYVTFHECAPMLPLESLSLGVPCIMGPVSHYFEDAPYLHQRLVVPYPDRAEVVASYILKAIEERTEIIEAYRDYIPGYNDRARQHLERFLDI